VPRRSYLYLVLLPALAALFIADTIASADIACAEGCAVQGAQAQQPTLSEMTTAFTQAGTNTLPSGYFSLPLIEAGPQGALQAGSAPCALLKAIAYVESSWHQATYSAARGSTGPTLVSFDCGYGIMQITSGMRNRGDLPNDVQERIAIDYLYNIGWGAKMLIDKWNLAPTYAPVVGDRNPAVAEAWYFAVWGFNGWSISNNPNYCDRDNGGQLCPRPPFNGSQNRTDYPYQELVWGYAANPPMEGGARLWDPAALTLPDTRSIPST